MRILALGVGCLLTCSCLRSNVEASSFVKFKKPRVIFDVAQAIGQPLEKWLELLGPNFKSRYDGPDGIATTGEGGKFVTWKGSALIIYATFKKDGELDWCYCANENQKKVIDAEFLEKLGFSGNIKSIKHGTVLKLKPALQGYVVKSDGLQKNGSTVPSFGIRISRSK